MNDAIAAHYTRSASIAFLMQQMTHEMRIHNAYGNKDAQACIIVLRNKIQKDYEATFGVEPNWEY